MLNKEEIRRYNRHIIMPEVGIEGQKKLKQAKVLVVGAGGLGCPVLQYIAAAGVGTIGICDFDFVDESNLQRQILFTSDDVGKPKASIAAKRLKMLNKHVDFVVHNKMLTKDNVLELFNAYDIIVDGSDNFPTRFLVNDACVVLNKPLVFGAIYKFEGQLSVFNYKGGPTYRCLIPEEPDASEMPSCSQIGVIGVLPGIIGSYQANEVIKIITDVGEVLSGKLLMVDTLKLQHTILSVKRNDSVANIKELSEYGDFCQNISINVKQISALELHERMKSNNIKIYDIREKVLFDSYRIKSDNVSIDDLLFNPEFLNLKQDIVLVCEKGVNSAAIIEELEGDNKDYSLLNLEGGIQNWIAAELPIINNKDE